jgi:hypothetical protein
MVGAGEMAPTLGKIERPIEEARRTITKEARLRLLR